MSRYITAALLVAARQPALALSWIARARVAHGLMCSHCTAGLALLHLSCPSHGRWHPRGLRSRELALRTYPTLHGTHPAAGPPSPRTLLPAAKCPHNALLTVIYRYSPACAVSAAASPPPSPTASLRRDHDLIEKVVRAMEAAAVLLRRGAGVPAPVIGQVVDFTSNFTDVCHHGKEENALFPALERAGMPSRMGPIAVMLAEHERSREIAGRMARAAESYERDGSARGELASAMEEYASHITEHIWKENNRLFMMADARLAPSAGRVAADLDSTEEERLGRAGAGRGHYERIADDLSRSMAAEPDRRGGPSGPSVEWEA